MAIYDEHSSDQRSSEISTGNKVFDTVSSHLSTSSNHGSPNVCLAQNGKADHKLEDKRHSH